MRLVCQLMLFSTLYVTLPHNLIKSIHNICKTEETQVVVERSVVPLEFITFSESTLYYFGCIFCGLTTRHERMFCQTGGSNPRPSEYHADVHPTELLGSAPYTILYAN